MDPSAPERKPDRGSPLSTGDDHLDDNAADPGLKDITVGTFGTKFIF